MKVAKETRIKRELSKYKKMFAELDEEKKKFAEKLYKQAAFMSATLDDLQESINEKGPVVEGMNGNGFNTTMENPAQKSYNTMIRNYNATIKQLMELLPTDIGEGDEFLNYINNRK